MIHNSDSKACRIRGRLTVHGHLDELENNNSRKKHNWSGNSEFRIQSEVRARFQG